MIFYIFVCLFVSVLAIKIISKITCGRTMSNTCLLNKTVLVTGATQGIGYQVALGIASRGARLIIADVVDTAGAVKNIIHFTNNPNVIGKHIDLGSFKSIRQFVKEFKQSEENLHILINNAGIGYSNEELTEDGLNKLMQINHYGPFLLTHLLVDLLKKSAPSRVVFTSSCSAFLAAINLRACDNPVTFGQGLWNYCNSKLANIITSDIFAKKLKFLNVTCNSVHPGLVSSGIVIKAFKMATKERKIFKTLGTIIILVLTFLFGKDSWEGSLTILHVALSKNCNKITGEHFWDCKPFWKPPKAYNKKFCDKVWEISEKNAMLTEYEKL